MKNIPSQQLQTIPPPEKLFIPPPLVILFRIHRRLIIFKILDCKFNRVPGAKYAFFSFCVYYPFHAFEVDLPEFGSGTGSAIVFWVGYGSVKKITDPKRCLEIPIQEI